jgi:hypothetical protein
MKKIETIAGIIFIVGGLACTGIGYKGMEKDYEKIFPQAMLYGGLITSAIGTGIFGRSILEEDERKNYKK